MTRGHLQTEALKTLGILAFVLAALTAVAFLAGCSAMQPAPEPRIVVKTVNVPVTVTCLPESFERAAPGYPDRKADIAAGDVQKRAQLATAANILLHARNDILEEIVRGCDRH